MTLTNINLKSHNKKRLSLKFILRKTERKIEREIESWYGALYALFLLHIPVCRCVASHPH